jgi:hypothetical protein
MRRSRRSKPDPKGMVSDTSVLVVGFSYTSTPTMAA